MDDQVQQPTRRDALRRGALVAGATVWAAPAVQTLAAPAFAAGSPPVEENPCTGCLTGGGELVEEVVFEDTPGAVVTLTTGLSPICCGEEPKPGTELQVNIHKADTQNKDDVIFHFDQNLVVQCFNDTSCDAEQPAYCANRFVGSIYTTDGDRLDFDLTDCGEQQGAVDRVTLKITDSGGDVLVNASGSLEKGNLQAHLALGPIERVCNC
jgi:hypothetical protein